MKGDFGESLATTLIGQYTKDGQLFETIAIGGKWPTIDIYAEIIHSTNQKMICFFQVKSTTLGYSKNGKKLKVQITVENLNKLSAYHAPTYLIGVDYNENEPTFSRCFIKTIRGNYTIGFKSIETTYPLSPANLLVLKNEVEAFWNTLDTLPLKSNYLTNFL